MYTVAVYMPLDFCKENQNKISIQKVRENAYGYYVRGPDWRLT